MIQKKVYEFIGEDLQDLDDLYLNLFESLSHRKKYHPEFNFKIIRKLTEDKSKGVIKVKVIDLGTEAN